MKKSCWKLYIEASRIIRKILYLPKNLNFHKIILTPLYVNTCDINEKHVISNEKQL